MITVYGRRLNVVQKPYIYFSLNDSYFRQVILGLPYLTLPYGAGVLPPSTAVHHTRQLQD